MNNLYINDFICLSSPLDQFDIRTLISLNAPIFSNINISITNIGLYLIIAGSSIIILTILAINLNKLVGNK